VRIFVELPFSDPSDQLDGVVRQAVAILRDGRIQSAREGGAINGRAVVRVDAADLPEARARLAEAGMRTAID
jgi:hypothetical protein